MTWIRTVFSVILLLVDIKYGDSAWGNQGHGKDFLTVDPQLRTSTAYHWKTTVRPAENKRNFRAVLFITYDDSYEKNGIEQHELTPELFNKLTSSNDYVKGVRNIKSTYGALEFFDGRCDVNIKCDSRIGECTTPTVGPCECTTTMTSTTRPTTSTSRTSTTSKPSTTSTTRPTTSTSRTSTTSKPTTTSTTRPTTSTTRPTTSTSRSLTTTKPTTTTSRSSTTTKPTTTSTTRPTTSTSRTSTTTKPMTTSTTRPTTSMSTTTRTRTYIPPSIPSRPTTTRWTGTTRSYSRHPWPTQGTWIHYPTGTRPPRRSTTSITRTTKGLYVNEDKNAMDYVPAHK